MVNGQGRSQWGAAACALILMALAGCATVPAPSDQLAVAKAAVSDAVGAGGGEFTPAELRAAQEKLDQADRAMRAEDYRAARRLAEEAEVDAKLAATKARSLKAQRAVAELRESIRALQLELDRRPL